MTLRIAIEGIDGSGKGTQAARLRDRLTESGLRAALVSFPRYAETFFGRAVGEFLDGRFGPADAVDPFLVSLLFAGDRFESRGLLERAAAENDVLILDRYVPSNVAYQAAKLDEPRRPELAEWVERIEHGIYGLPRADLVLLLDLPAPAAQARIARKQPRTYTNRPADLHEADADYLSRVRAAYLELAAGDPAWHVIDSFRGSDPRSIDDIAAEIERIVRGRLQ